MRLRGFDDKPEIRLGMMLGDYRVDADLGRKTPGAPRRPLVRQVPLDASRGFSPSLRLAIPDRSRAEMWTNTSFPAVIPSNKPETLLGVEPLHCACLLDR